MIYMKKCYRDNLDKTKSMAIIGDVFERDTGTVS